MPEIATYQFPTTGQSVRTVLRDGEPWFVAVDVAAALDLGNPHSSLALLDDDEKGLHSMETLGGAQSVIVVNEAGLYSLILRSRKPEAKAFKRWVTHDVLPAIRQTGRYETPATPPSRAELARRWYEAEVALEETQARLAVAAPKAEAYEAFMDADGTYSLEQVAKMLYAESGLGRNKLIARLRALRVLEDNNLPYQRHMHHFHVVASEFITGEGRRHTRYTTRVRATGVDFVRRQLGLAQGVLVPVP